MPPSVRSSKGDVGMTGRGNTLTESPTAIARDQEPYSLTECGDPLIALIEGWLVAETGYDEETWPELKAALDRDRLSDRKLFVA